MQKNMLEVGLNDDWEIVVNHPDLEPDENGVGHIVFSAKQARHFADILLLKSKESDAHKSNHPRSEDQKRKGIKGRCQPQRTKTKNC
jgi:hypothetical protein